MSASARFGQSLREARERRGLSVEQLAQETTIPVQHIEALECGAVESLPRAMYRRAEARAYAEAVGLDPDVVLTQLRQTGEKPVAAERREDATTGAETTVPGESTQREQDSVVTTAMAPLPSRAERTPPPEHHDVVGRVTRALVLLVIGCAALMWEDKGSPVLETPITTAAVVPQLDASNVVSDPTGSIESPVSTPGVRHVLYEPRIAANGERWPVDARLDEGVLVVDSAPRGARVTVNGVGWGETPVAIRYLPMGTMRVRVGKEDHGFQEREVKLTAEQPTATVRFNLPAPKRRTASAAPRQNNMLVITSVPPGARVTVNGIGWGTTPVSIPHVPAGAQRVRIVKEQFVSEERIVHIGEDQPGRISVTLKPES